MSSPERGSDPLEVTFEPLEFGGRLIERGVDRPGTTAVGLRVPLVGTDDVESAPADLDDGPRRHRCPSVGHHPVDAEWRTTSRLEHGHVTIGADVEQGVVGFEGRVGDAQAAGRTPEPVPPGTRRVLPPGVGSGGTTDRGR